MERIESGIPGLDKMIQGGFPFPSAVLVGGEPGTGKTTLILQSLFHGIEQGETGLYFTAISEPSWVIQKFLGEFSFYSQKMIETQKMIFIDIDGPISEDPDIVLDVIMKNVEKYKPKRVAIDPVTSIENSLKDVTAYRKFLHNFILSMKSQGCVTLMTAECSYSNMARSLDAYMVDALIILSYMEIENTRKKYLEVLKMRGTNHLTGRRSLMISKNGLVVQPELR